jgi:hypothetical protein
MEGFRCSQIHMLVERHGKNQNQKMSLQKLTKNSHNYTFFQRKSLYCCFKAGYLLFIKLHKVDMRESVQLFSTERGKVIILFKKLVWDNYT